MPDEEIHVTPASANEPVQPSPSTTPPIKPGVALRVSRPSAKSSRTTPSSAPISTNGSAAYSGSQHQARACTSRSKTPVLVSRRTFGSPTVVEPHLLRARRGPDRPRRPVARRGPAVPASTSSRVCLTAGGCTGCCGEIGSEAASDSTHAGPGSLRPAPPPIHARHFVVRGRGISS
jgi:hypothetical protein